MANILAKDMSPSQTTQRRVWKYAAVGQKNHRPAVFEDTPNCLQNTTDPAVQNYHLLRRLILDEKAQLIEMFHLGVFTTDEFKTQLAQIEARYESQTWASPAERPRLAQL
ncbi:hypothetical protein K438DRAFT_1792117 [Mycena galopus ATCC 62051]|nr:hypothetical protein K438DRAFT_1792117 [Mycena galopus ATCC 62051]